MLKLAIVSPDLPYYSESFIQAHIERLPADITLLYRGDFRPAFYGDGQRIIFHKPIHLAVDYFKHRYFGMSMDALKDRGIARLLKSKGIQVVLAEYGTFGAGTIPASKLAHVPLIVFFRGYDIFNQHILNGPGRLYGELFQTARAVIGVSHEIVSKLAEMGADPNKLYHIPSGVDINKFTVSDPSQSPPVFLAVGRFVNKKAPDLTLLAFKDAVNQVPEARLLFAGDGELREVCQRLTNIYGLENQVSFLGVCSHKEVAEHMQHVRAFVQHSITTLSGDKEGTPNSIKEAHASGLPVIATRHGGIPEIVVDGETGFLVQEGDVHSMADAMIRLAQEPQLARQMGRAGREHVEQHFDMEPSLTQLWKIIQSVV